MSRVNPLNQFANGSSFGIGVDAAALIRASPNRLTTPLRPKGMADYTITFVRSARKELEARPPDLAARMLRKITALAKVPRPAGVKKLHGEDDLWRIRIGDYRVIYAIDDTAKVVDVVVVRHRSEVYRDF
jgi:mRNA interferase RelE/StbE